MKSLLDRYHTSRLSNSIVLDPSVHQKFSLRKTLDEVTDPDTP